DQISPLEEGNVGVLSEGAQKIALADVAERNERLAYPLTGADAPVQGLVELRLSDEAGFDQRLTEPNSARHEDVVARATGCAPETRSVVGWRTTQRGGRDGLRPACTLGLLQLRFTSRFATSCGPGGTQKKPPRSDPWQLIELAMRLTQGFLGGVDGRAESSVSPATVNSSRCDPPLSSRSIALRSGASYGKSRRLAAESPAAKWAIRCSSKRFT